MYDIIIINLDEGSYLGMTPKKALSKAEKDKKGLCLQAYLEHSRSFNPMVYSVNRTTGEEALAAQSRLAALISFKLNQDTPNSVDF